jgi:hypothetical protein
MATQVDRKGPKKTKPKKKKKDKRRKPNNEITNHTCKEYIAIKIATKWNLFLGGSVHLELWEHELETSL